MQFSTADKQIVFVNDETQHHLTAHPDVIALLPEAISKLIIGDSVSRVEKEITLDRAIGISSLIEVPKVSIDQKTYFALRNARSYPSHVALDKEGEACNTVTVEVT